MKRLFLQLIVIAVILLGMIRCYYNNEEKLYQSIPVGCDNTDVRYNTTIRDILSRNCYSCHASDVASSFGGGVKLDSYEEAKSHINQIFGAVTHQDGYPPMPKDAPMLDSCKINAIKIWMDAGAPNN